MYIILPAYTAIIESAITAYDSIVADTEFDDISVEETTR